ncbi:MAG: hypothetical protein ABEK36_00270 [Candidatus Aenigmatarchaeota archaeon]
MLEINPEEGLRCPECNGKMIEKQDDGRNILLVCRDCDLVLEDRLTILGQNIIY